MSSLALSFKISTQLYAVCNMILDTKITILFALVQFSFHRVHHYMLSEQRQYGMRSLPQTSTHDQQWKSNTRLLDLEFNALFTETYDPMQTLGFCFFLLLDMRNALLLRYL